MNLFWKYIIQKYTITIYNQFKIEKIKFAQKTENLNFYSFFGLRLFNCFKYLNVSNNMHKDIM